MSSMPNQSKKNRVLLVLPLIAAFAAQFGAVTLSSVSAEGGNPPWFEPKVVTLKKTTTGSSSTTVGTEFNYKIEIENRTEASATIVLTDVLPSETQLVGSPTVEVISPTVALTSTGTSTTTLVWQGALSTGAKAAVTIRVKLAACPAKPVYWEGGIVNTALMTINNRGISISSVAFRPAGCTASGTPQPTPTPSPTSTVPGADVAVRAFGRLHPDWDAPELGWRASWLDFYANRGNQAATDVVLLDKPSDNQTLNRIFSAPSFTPTTTADGLRFAIGSLPSLKGGTVLLRTSVPFSATAGTVLTNRVTVSATNDITPSNNTASVAITLPVLPPLITYPRSGLTFTGTMTITGKAQSNASIAVYVDHTLISTTVASTAGDWSVPAQLADGVHSIYAMIGTRKSAEDANSIAGDDDGWREWHQSNAVIVKVDSSLVWDPISLMFTAADGNKARLHGWLGWHDRDGWYVGLQPSTTYTVSVRVCCTPATVSMTVPSVGNVAMTDANADLVYQSTFTTGSARALLSDTLKLCVQANGTTQCSTGRVIPVHRRSDHVVLITPEGFDPPRVTASPGEVIEIVNMSDDARAIGSSRNLADDFSAQNADAGSDAVRLEVGESYTVQASTTQSLYNAENSGQSVTIATGTLGNGVYLPLVRR